MSAKAHYNFPGIPQLIYQKTLNNKICFFVDKDYQYYLDLLEVASNKYKCQIHAYGLMPHHVCILATPYSDHGIEQLMHDVANQYTQHIAKTYGNTGSLWDGGYDSSILDSKSMLLSCMHYIEQEPVRAELVNQAADYKWSSYASNALGKSNKLLKPHSDYMALADESAERIQTYKLEVSGLSQQHISEIQQALDNGQPLGPEMFKHKVAEIIEKANQGEVECVSCVMVY